jgi:hypothetical protein
LAWLQHGFRAYLDTGRCVLEVKTRDGRGRTVKTQRDHALDHRDRLDGVGRELGRAYPLIGEQAARLQPALTTRYARSTLLLPAAGVRATLDTDVRREAPDGRIAELAGMVIIESNSRCTSVDRLLWSMGLSTLRVSSSAPAGRPVPGCPATSGRARSTSRGRFRSRLVGAAPR